jgi:hypothetical protein
METQDALKAKGTYETQNYQNQLQSLQQQYGTNLFNLNANLASSGAMTSQGSRQQHSDLASQLALAQKQAGQANTYQQQALADQQSRLTNAFNVNSLSLQQQLLMNFFKSIGVK